MTVNRLFQQFLSDFTFGQDQFPASEETPQFTFGPVSPGFVWTGTISITPATNIANVPGIPAPRFNQFNPNAEIVNSIQWVLYRNNIPEHTWMGMAELCNFQMFPNDVVVLVGKTPLTGMPANFTSENPVGLIATYAGYVSNTSDAIFQVPFLSSVPNLPNAAASIPANGLKVASAAIVAAGTTTIIPANATLPGLTIPSHKLWDASICISVNSSGAGTGANATIQTAAGTPILAAGVVGNGVEVVEQDLKGILTQTIGLGPIYPIQFVVNTSGVTGLYITYNLLYTAEAII